MIMLITPAVLVSDWLNHPKLECIVIFLHFDWFSGFHCLSGSGYGIPTEVNHLRYRYGETLRAILHAKEQLQCDTLKPGTAEPGGGLKPFHFLQLM